MQLTNCPAMTAAPPDSGSVGRPRSAHGTPFPPSHTHAHTPATHTVTPSHTHTPVTHDHTLPLSSLGTCCALYCRLGRGSGRSASTECAAAALPDRFLGGPRQRASGGQTPSPPPLHFLSERSHAPPRLSTGSRRRRVLHQSLVSRSTRYQTLLCRPMVTIWRFSGLSRHCAHGR